MKNKTYQLFLAALLVLLAITVKVAIVVKINQHIVMTTQNNWVLK